MDRVSVALIGTGMWAGRIAAAVARTDRLELVTCFSRDPARREMFARDHGIDAAPSLEAAIEDSRVEGVLLVTPNAVHARRTRSRTPSRFGRRAAPQASSSSSVTASGDSVAPAPPSAGARSGRSSSLRRRSRYPGR